MLYLNKSVQHLPVITRGIQEFDINLLYIYSLFSFNLFNFHLENSINKSILMLNIITYTYNVKYNT